MIIGSRRLERARTKVGEGVDRNLAGNTVVDAAADGRVIVSAFPPEYIVSTIEDLESVLTHEKIFIIQW